MYMVVILYSCSKQMIVTDEPERWASARNRSVYCCNIAHRVIAVPLVEAFNSAI